MFLVCSGRVTMQCAKKSQSAPNWQIFQQFFFSSQTSETICTAFVWHPWQPVRVCLFVCVCVCECGVGCVVCVWGVCVWETDSQRQRGTKVGATLPSGSRLEMANRFLPSGNKTWDTITSAHPKARAQLHADTYTQLHPHPQLHTHTHTHLDTQTHRHAHTASRTHSPVCHPQEPSLANWSSGFFVEIRGGGGGNKSMRSARTSLEYVADKLCTLVWLISFCTNW